VSCRHVGERPRSRFCDARSRQGYCRASRIRWPSPHQRHPFPVTESCFCSGPFAPRSLPASSLLGAGPTPDRSRLWRYAFPPERWSLFSEPLRRVSQVPRLIFLRTPSPTTPEGPAGAFAHCFPAGGRPLSSTEDRSPPFCANEAETGSLAL
jgi:hypothetical protein